MRFYLRRTPTLFGARDDYDEADYVVFGVPFDSTSCFRPGCRLGPLAIRVMSEEVSCVGLDAIVRRTADMGDLIPTVSIRWMLRRTWKVVREILSDGKRPIILGGEHTLTLASFAALSRLGDASLVIFDAHLDLLDEYVDTRVNHATWFRRLLERVDAKAALIGFRDYAEEGLRFGEERVKLMVSADRVHESIDDVLRELEGFLDGSKRIYISIDIDVLDPAYAPGVGNPSLGGLTPVQLKMLLKPILRKEFMALDVVEVNPLFDGGVSASQAAHLIAYILSSS